MDRVVLLVPIMPDKVEAWRRLCQEVAGTRREQYEASRERLGIRHERVRLLRLLHTDVAVHSFEAADPERALADLVCSTAPFDLWFKRQVLDVHGLDLNELVSASDRELELLFNWRASDEGCSQRIVHDC